MEEKERILTYITGIYILTFLGEWNKSERIGMKAKIYNTIAKKHDMFLKQILKKKKCSKNCQLFSKASKFAILGWSKATKDKDTKNITISGSTTIRNIYNFNKENFTRIYGLTEENFIELDKESHVQVFSSCKMGRILVDYAKEAIDY